jgi:hypothetical protein
VLIEPPILGCAAPPSVSPWSPRDLANPRPVVFHSTNRGGTNRGGTNRGGAVIVQRAVAMPSSSPSDQGLLLQSGMIRFWICGLPDPFRAWFEAAVDAGSRCSELASGARVLTPRKIAFKCSLN